MIIKQKDILEEIRNTILASGYSDFELSEKSGLSKEGIYKIRSGKTVSIRSGNATKLLEVLDKKLSSSSDGLVITDIIKPLNVKGIGSMSKEATTELLTSQIKIINHLMSDKNNLEKQVSKLENKLKEKSSEVLNTLPNLDPSRAQAQIRIDTASFVVTTNKYNKIFGYDPLELSATDYMKTLDTDEHGRIMVKSNNPKDYDKDVWKCRKKDDSIVYIESILRVFNTQNNIKFGIIDIKEIIEIEYQKALGLYYETDGLIGQG
jgi:transcriptional regulator with XRE-family HTH domain